MHTESALSSVLIVHENFLATASLRKVTELPESINASISVLLTTTLQILLERDGGEAAKKCKAETCFDDD